VRIAPGAVPRYVASLTLEELRTVDYLCDQFCQTRTLPRLAPSVSLLAFQETPLAEDIQQRSARQLALRIEFALDACRSGRWRTLPWLRDIRSDLEMLLIDSWYHCAIPWAERRLRRCDKR
jgi:hypothetical protein